MRNPGEPRLMRPFLKGSNIEIFSEESMRKGLGILARIVRNDMAIAN